jgi:hypothetical protein
MTVAKRAIIAILLLSAGVSSAQTPRRAPGTPKSASGGSGTTSIGGPAPPSFTLISHVIANSLDNNTVTTAGITTTGAGLIVVSVGGFTATSVLSDSNNNTWVPLTSVGNGNDRGQLYYCLTPVVGAGHTFTITNGGTYPSISVQAWSTTSHTPISFDQSSGSNTVATGPGSITPASGTALFVAATAGAVPSTDTSTIGSSFTITDQFGNGGGGSNARSLAMAWKLSAAPENPIWSPDGASVSLLVDFLP